MSISSGQTEGSPPWKDLSKLGEYILAHLGGEDTEHDLLTHWVAHRLAEHMQRAEAADDPGEREDAREAAAQLIPKLWAARGGWPRGWPPPPLATLTQGLERVAGDRFGRVGEPGRQPPWLSTFDQLEQLARDERKVWFYGALLEVGVDEVRAALEAADRLDPDGEDLAEMRIQLRHHDEAIDWLAELAGEGEDPYRRAHRVQIFERVLSEIADRRRQLSELTLKDARRGQRRKPVHQGSVLPSPGARIRRRLAAGDEALDTDL